MVRRGLDASDQDVNIGGALRDEVSPDITSDAENPSDTQRQFLERQKAADEALKKLQSEDR
jgi:hypothetical protein